MIKSKHRELVEIPKSLVPEQRTAITQRTNMFWSNDEDDMLDTIYTKVGTVNKVCIELYSANGIKKSLSRNLIINHGWSAVLLENNYNSFAELQELYSKYDAVVTLLKTVVSLEQHECVVMNRVKLDHVKEVPDQCDLLILDVGGLEYHIWDSLHRIQARVVACRFNLTMHNSLDFVQEEDPSVHHGNSFRAFVRIGRLKDYEVVGCSKDYVFFCAKSIV